MKFTLYKDVLTQDGKEATWIEAGQYTVVRLFDNKRLVLDLGSTVNNDRQITLVQMSKGQLSVG